MFRLGKSPYLNLHVHWSNLYHDSLDVRMCPVKDRKRAAFNNQRIHSSGPPVSYATCDTNRSRSVDTVHLPQLLAFVAKCVQMGRSHKAAPWCRYHAVLFPVTHFICEMLPEQMRESTRTELFFDDLEKLPSMEVARICEWLTEKVDGFSSKTRAEPKDVEEEVGRVTAADVLRCAFAQVLHRCVS